MKVTVNCFGRLKDYVPSGANQKGATLNLPDSCEVAIAIDALAIPASYIYVVLVNGERSDRSTRLREGDEVTFMPPFSGG